MTFCLSHQPRNSIRKTSPATARASLVAPVRVVGTQPRPVFGNIDYQSVIKRTVETQSKKVHVSTPLLKLHLIINDLRNPPWPHPAHAHQCPARAHQCPAKVHQFLATALLHQVTTLLVFPKSRLQKSTMHDISLPPSSA